jgi:hypothetical protein
VTDLTTHASRRCQQRCISALARALVQDYGEERPNHDGTVTIAMTRAGRARIEADHGEALLRQLGRALDITLIVAGDGPIITTYWRENRFERDRGPPWERRAHCERRRSRRNFR